MNMGISTSMPHRLSVVIAVVDDKLTQIPNIMEMVHFFAVTAVVLFALLSLLLPRAAKPSKPPPPPSPSPFPVPILGHLHLLLPLGKSNPLHRSLASLASLHGGVLSLRLGSRRALLVSSAAAAAECFSSRDAAFASRPRLLAGKHLGYAYTTLVWAPYGAHWRNLRRIVAVELFSPAQLSASAQIRADEVAELVNALARASEGPDRGVVMKPRLFAMAMNVMMRMIAGKRYYVGGREAGESGSAGSEEEEARRFQEIVEETFAVSAATNLGDFVPLLRVLDYKGLARRLVRLQEKRDKFMQGIVDEHRRMRRRGGDADDDDRGEEGRKTIIDVLLNLQESDPEYYTDEIIKGVLVVMLSAGTDTSVVTIEWAMALLVSHPDVLEKARAEVDLRVGSGRLVRESDLSDLPYLQCIVKETLRLYPAGPVIPAHESTEDCTVAGYHVPRGTMLLVNAWAIQRDPTNWTEPTQFRPERFLVEREEVDGSMVMLPFGLGRRRCPGEALAMRVVGLAVAALVQCFEWEAGVEGVDMTEGTGLTMPMAKPLVTACRPRTAVIHAQLATAVGAA